MRHPKKFERRLFLNVVQFFAMLCHGECLFHDWPSQNGHSRQPQDATLPARPSIAAKHEGWPQ
ncbi:hypothetical protein [Vogesella alkaliphila]|uniref:hypothetical protein n=1 Tax=Vogesella alkaliphila TaxID=1193621 RepID=UPI0016799044|nr:hypothetical protein [Vogesella alkaliphila]